MAQVLSPQTLVNFSRFFPRSHSALVNFNRFFPRFQSALVNFSQLQSVLVNFSQLNQVTQDKKTQFFLATGRWGKTTPNSLVEEEEKDEHGKCGCFLRERRIPQEVGSWEFFVSCSSQRRLGRENANFHGRSCSLIFRSRVGSLVSKRIPSPRFSPGSCPKAPASPPVL